MKGVDSDNVLNCHSFDQRYYLLVILEMEMADDANVELTCGTTVWQNYNLPYRACTGKGEARLGMDIKFEGGKALGGIDCVTTVE